MYIRKICVIICYTSKRKMNTQTILRICCNIMKENNKEGSLKLRMIKIKIKITNNFNILKSQLTILSKKLMVGAMAATFCGTNREIIIMKLMQS